MEADVLVSPCQDSASDSDVLVKLSSEAGETERRILLGRDLVAVQEADGSYRRLPFSPEQSSSDSVRFFHAGRVRAVASVGGVGGRVEGNQSEGTVVAPMNGQVVKTLVGEGQTVEVGEIVLILEAMKMENEVTAPISGTIAAIQVATGDTVAPGQVLFSIEESE